VISTERSPTDHRLHGPDAGDAAYQSQQFAFNRALAVAGIVTTLTIPLAFYARVTAPDPTHVPFVSTDGRGYYLASLFLVGFIAVLVHRLETDDPARMVNRYGERIYQFRRPAPRTAWIVPAGALFAISFFLALNHQLLVVLLSPLVAGGVVLGSRLVRHQVMMSPSGPARLMRIAHQTIVVGVAFGAFVVVYSFRARTLYAGPTLFILSLLLMLAFFDGLTTAAARRMVYAGIGGLAVTQLVWGLNYWNTTGLIGGGLLATVFIFYATVSRTHLSDGITQRQVIERATVTAPLFLVLAYIAE
jgi:hypothetical protein